MLDRFFTLLRLTVKDFFIDDGPEWAAAVAYYTLLSIFPLLLAVAGIAAFFVDPNWVVDQITTVLGGILPRGETRIDSIVNSAVEARRGISIISIVILLWSGSRVFRAITKALNIAFDVDDTYGFLKRVVVELVMLLSIGVFFLIAVVSRVLLDALPTLFGTVPALQQLSSSLLVSVVPAVLLTTAFFLLYKFVPRRRPDWRAAVPGAVLATLLLLAARPLFLFFIQQFTNYNVIYGSLAIAVIGVLWAWIGAVILLFGGELVSHIQAMQIEGLSAEEVVRRHHARSPQRQNRPADAEVG